MIATWLLPIFCLLNFVCCDLTAIKYSNAWPDITLNEQVALRSQRDMSRNITIDQIPSIGVNLNSVLFNEESEYIDDNELHHDEMIILNSFESILNNAFQTFVLNLQVIQGNWMVKDSSVSLTDILNTLQKFLVESKDESAQNFITFLLNIDTWTDTNQLTSEIVTDLENYPTLNLSLIFETFLSESYIYKPADLTNLTKGITPNVTHITYNKTIANQNNTLGTITLNKTEIEGLQWPTLENVLFQQGKRVMFTELTNNLPFTLGSYIFPNFILNYDKGNTTLNCPTSVSDIDNLKKFSWRYLENEFSNDTIRNYLTCGISPIISNKMNIDNITNIVPLAKPGLLWLWQINEPELTNSKLLLGKDSISPINCGLMTFYAHNDSMLLSSENCFHNKYGLCQKIDHSGTWLITTQQESFFNFYDIDLSDDRKPLCPDGYKLAIPKIPIDQLSLSFYINGSTFQDENIEFWVDMNSVAVSNCWVVGGPNVTCPYVKATSSRNFLAMVLPISIIALCLLLLDLYLCVQRVPIHDNRKNWRKIVSSVSKTEFEGVPS